MSIVRYDPFRDLRTLQEEVNRLFSNNLSLSFGEEGIARGAWNPNVDIYENKDQIVLEAELPGMNRGDFDLTIENNVITLRGERHFEKKDETDNYHRVERSYGSFSRSFTLPQTVSGDGATAEKTWLKVIEIEKTTSLAAQSHFGLAGLYRKQGKTAQAQREMQEFQKLQSTIGPPRSE